MRAHHPPVLEVYVLWHPSDDRDGQLLQGVLGHFHGNAYSGLLGGAIEVFARSAGWRDTRDAPRPIPLPDLPAPVGVLAAGLVAVVVLAGTGLARATEDPGSPWSAALDVILGQQARHPGRVRVFPVRSSTRAAPADCRLQSVLSMQAITDTGPQATCRDLAQGLAQWAASGPDGMAPARLKVFISHTKHDGAGSDLVARLIAQVRDRIGASRLASFFDANALQAGEDWDAALRKEASGHALLALRTDLYASREWCQREMVIAKRCGLPVVVLDAPVHGEPRGSFLMDHVIRVPVRREGDGWRDADIDTGLARLVDACLQNELWIRSRNQAEADDTIAIDWWSAQAPEPATLVDWLVRHPRPSADGTRPVRILHPDPPLGPEERDVLERMATLAGVGTGIEILTPRTLAARGG